MSQYSEDERPVSVIEAIPVAGAHRVSEEEIRRESIPTPEHLQLHPELGRGAMGRIHPATDRNLLRHVALKRLDQRYARVPMYRDGFIAEAQMTGQLEHPNIVPVHELSVSAGGTPYFTMKLVQGVDFNRWLRARPVGHAERLTEGLEIFLKVCDGMAYAHHRGVIHRDLKPENVMVGDFGQVYLMDWGLARLSKMRPASGSTAQMEAHGPVGTPTHMAPEQARGNPADMDEQSDVFGLGAVLYEIVTGKTPYGPFRDINETLERAKAGKVIPVEKAASDVSISRRMQDIVNRAVAPDKASRYPNVMALAEDVRSFLRGGLHLPMKVFRQGAVIIREGDPGDTAYMIVNGRCSAYRMVDGQKESLVEMGPGEVFGEMALLLDEPRAASVEALDQVTVLVLDKSIIDQGLGVDGWLSALVKALASRFKALEEQFRESGLRRR